MTPPIPPDTLDFFNELMVNNNRDWFTANKERYTACRKHFERFSEDYIRRLTALAEENRSEIDGFIGTSTIQSIDTTGAARISVAVDHREESLRPWVNLILAPPRPRVMKRLLPQLATLGVGKIVLVGAKKVEKDFWGATLLKPENYRPLLIDGLMQAGTSILPTIELRRNFRKFVREELDALLPSSNRIVAHPYEAKDARPETGDRSQSTNRPIDQSNNSSLTLAIGPEGGWTDEEVALLEEHGFSRYSLGSRILRTDTATIALLAQLMLKLDVG